MEKSSKKPEKAPTLPDSFLISLKYQNNLPNAPSGPFLKKVEMLNSFDEFPEFRTSTLEKGYVWQPHFGPDLAVNIDLVDQEAILAQDPNVVLDQSDLRFLSSSTVDKSRGKAKQIDQASKPWWLRNTTYVENNLFNINRVKTAKAEAAAAKREAAKMIKKDIFSIEDINDSFISVDKAVEGLANKTKSRKVLRVMPVLPLNSVVDANRAHSLVRFDEDPLTAAPKRKRGPQEQLEQNGVGKKFSKMDVAIITNVRQPVTTEIKKSVTLLEASLVSPRIGAKIVVADNGKQEGNAPEGEEEKAPEDDDLLDEEGAGSSGTYRWANDYTLDLQQDQTDTYLFSLPSRASSSSSGRSSNGSNTSASSSSSSASSGSASSGSAGSMASVVSSLPMRYFPVQMRIDMKKINPEDAQPHQAVVIKEQSTGSATTVVTTSKTATATITADTNGAL